MSVRPDSLPAATHSLSGTEGELISIHVCVEPRDLERLLESLSGLSFPVNPQIYHQAGMSIDYRDGRKEMRHVTMIKFPAFSRHLEEVRQVMEESGLPANALHTRGMLEEIHSDCCTVSAPPDAEYARITYYKMVPEACGQVACGAAAG